MTLDEYLSSMPETARNQTVSARLLVPIRNPIGPPNCIEEDRNHQLGHMLRLNDANGVGRAIVVVKNGYIIYAEVDPKLEGYGLIHALTSAFESAGATHASIGTIGGAKAAHRWQVYLAARKGKQIPNHVLLDYPELFNLI